MENNELERNKAIYLTINVFGFFLGVGLLFTALYMMGIIIFIMIFIHVLIMGGRISNKEKKIAEGKEQLQIDLYNKKISELKSKYGDITNIIKLSPYSLDCQVLVFEEKNRIIIFDKDMALNDIVSCDIQDSPRTFGGDTITTHKSTASVIGRAAIGGVLFGGVGAAIGGLSGKEKSIRTSEYTIHDYDAVITINDLSNPVIKINFKDDKENLNKLFSLMKIIIKRNDNQKG